MTIDKYLRTSQMAAGKRNLLRLVITLFTCGIMAIAATAQNPPKAKQTVTYDARSAQSIGDVRVYDGHVTLTVTHLNPIRYRYQIARAVTLTPGPDISGIAGIPVLPKAASPANQSNAGRTPADTSRTAIDKAMADAVAIQGQLNAINNALRDANAFVDASDPQGKADVECTLLGKSCATSLASTALLTTVENALRPAIDVFSNIETLRTDLEVANSSILELSKNPANAAAAKEQSDLLKQMQSFLSAVDQQKAAIQLSQKTLAAFEAVFLQVISAGDSAYTMTENVDCGAFSKSVKLTLVRSARRDGDTTSGTNEMVTFDCPAEFSISAGVGITMLPRDRSFFIKGPVTPGGPSTFAQQNNSRVAPMPVLQVNARIHEWSEEIGLYGSVGAIVDISTGKVGTAVDYIFGPTVALRHAQFLITPAVHIGKVADLVGFQVGDTVPSAITTPPTQQNYHPSFAITFTYKIK